MKPKLKVGCAIAFVSTVFCLAGFYLAFGHRLDFVSASSELPKVYAKSKRLGLALTVEDMQRGLSVPVAENAAPEVRKFPAAVRKPEFDPDSFESALTANRADARRMLADHAELLRLARDAARKGRLDMQRNWVEGPYVLFQEYGPAKTAVRLLAASAQLKALDGDAEGAIADLTAARRLARLIGDEPTVISMLVMVANNAITSRAVEQVAASLEGNPGALTRLANLDGAVRPQPPFHFYLKAEVFMGATMLRNFDQFGGWQGFMAFGELDENAEMPKLDLSKMRTNGLPRGILARSQLTRHLQVWNRIWPTVTAPGTDPRDAGRLVDAEQAKIEQEKGLSYVASSILLPVLGLAGDALVRDQAQTRVTNAYLNVLTFRSRNARFPSTLAEAGIRATDPFDGAPLRYRSDGRSFRVWSVGSDGIDNDGKTIHELPPAPATSTGTSSLSKSDDIVAGFPEPQRKASTPRP